MNPLFEFEQQLTQAAEAMSRPLRGQAGRFPARSLRSWLSQQGFLVTHHFLERLLQRAQAEGVRLNPRTFGAEFRQAKHYKQTRDGYNTRVAVVRNLPLVYRLSGRQGNRIKLISVLPEGRRPPTTRAAGLTWL